MTFRDRDPEHRTAGRNNTVRRHDPARAHVRPRWVIVLGLLAVLALMLAGPLQSASPVIALQEITSEDGTPGEDGLIAAQADTPTWTPEPTSTPLPTETPLPTSTPFPTETPLPTATPEPTATETPLPTETAEPTSTPTPTNEASPENDDEFSVLTASGVLSLEVVEPSGGTVDFEVVQPGVTAELPGAVTINVSNTDGGWSGGDCTATLVSNPALGEGQTAPQLQWRESGSANWSNFGANNACIPSAEAAQDNSVAYEYDVRILTGWSNPPGNYSWTVTFTVSG